jgi:hypothetical protein
VNFPAATINFLATPLACMDPKGVHNSHSPDVSQSSNLGICLWQACHC